MGKSKKLDEEALPAVAVDLKVVLATKAEQRSKWLTKACKAVGGGAVKPGQLYDILTNRKVVQGVPDKVGQRMRRILQGHIALFSDKQQRYLLTECPLATTFKLDENERGSDEEGPAREAKRDAAAQVALQASAKRQRAEDEASKMEDMMARCRNFVRQNANTYEEREREVQQKLKEAEEAQQRMLRQQWAAEWAAITDWHKPLEAWERAQMASLDEPNLRHQQGAEASALPQGQFEAPQEAPARSASKKAQVSKSKSKKRSRSSSSDSRSRSKSKKRDRDRDQGKKNDRDRDRDRSRERHRPRSRDRDRQRGRSNRRRRHSSSSSR